MLRTFFGGLCSSVLCKEGLLSAFKPVAASWVLDCHQRHKSLLIVVWACFVALLVHWTTSAGSHAAPVHTCSQQAVSASALSSVFERRVKCVCM